MGTLRRFLLVGFLALGLGSAGAQTWAEHATGIPLPTRRVAHPFDLLAASDGRLVIAWISGADAKGALYVAVFREGKWSKPERLLELRRPTRFVLYELNGRPHLLECGSGGHLCARLEADEWKRIAYPLPKNARQPSVARGPDQSITVAYIGGVKRVSRTPRAGALSEVAGKAFLIRLPAQGRPSKPVGLDLSSRGSASRPVVAVDPSGKIHVLMERRYGRTAKPNIGHVIADKPKSAFRVSRQPGSRPALAVVSDKEMVALWNDRPGVVQCLHDGRSWNPPTVLVQKAVHPILHRGRNGRLYLTVFTTSRSLYYLTRGPRGWSTPIDFGTAAGPGRVVEASDGAVHLVWEAKGTFRHRTARPASEPSRKPADG